MFLAAFPVILSCLVGLTAARFASTPISHLRKGNVPELSKRDVDLETLYPAYNISVPIDYFHNESMYEPHSDGTFNLRYYFDAQFYKPGGPVILLAGGETSATDRLPYLQKGILYQLAKATHGIGVILEHRYYGTSFPTPDLSTKNLRFLTTQQALADTTYFAEHIEFPGLEHHNLKAPKTAYIAYGGSYAGAFVAFLRTTYPETFFGSIASSGVTVAIWDFWQYYSPVAKYGDTVVPQCVEYTQALTHIIDNILLSKKPKLIKRLKRAFGLEEIKYDDDFANTLSFGIGGWQGRNWDPEVNDPTFVNFCKNITSSKILYPKIAKNLTSEVKKLIKASNSGNRPSSSPFSFTSKHAYTARSSSALGKLLSRGWDTKDLTTHMLNYIGYISVTAISDAVDAGEDLNSYYTNHNSTFYALDSIAEGSWRSWPYQYCTQWGYLQTGSGVPQNQLPLISRLLTLEYESIICREAFGRHEPADVDIVNAYGGYDIAYDRLAFVDGEVDPWREVTPHSPAAKPRESTTERPFALIKDAVHHWDENGLFDNETTDTLPPKPVRDVQGLEVEFVKAWMKEFKKG